METTEWWSRPIAWLFARRPDWRDSSGRILLRVGNHFYVLLAILFALTGAWDQFVAPINPQLSDASFDWLMRNRPVAYKPDPDIVVLDIDEASLAGLSAQFGRWPWPRQVLADVAARLESAGARAVAFDILFADPDLANPASEQAFDRYVAGSRNSFFTAVRLNPKNDAQSQITVSKLNFAERDPDVPDAKVDRRRTIALLPPYFKSIYDTTRTGTINVALDADKEVRWYYNYETLGGYRIPSLPYRMAQALGWRLPAQRSLINWPKGATPYRTFSFADVQRAAQNRDEAFYRQFAGKIVLIGSTAPGLNDIKATPVDHAYPGIYLLATVIDNTKNRGFLRPLGRAWLFGAELLMLAGSVRLFSRTERSSAVAKYFVIIPVALAAISLLSVSVSNVLIDLSVPAAVFIGYFGIATIFETNSHAFQSGTGPFAPTPREVATGRLQVACLPASLPQSAVTAMLMRPGCPIKLWTPQKAGLGKHWNGQGWVVWRWSTPAAPAEPSKTAAAGPPDLDVRWYDVPAPGANGGAFCLAHAIAAAALDSPAAGPVSPNPRAEPA
jgi:CHASE2 domain-containing sensor protein